MWWKALANEIAWRGRLIQYPLWRCDTCGSRAMEILIMHRVENQDSIPKKYRSLVMLRCDQCETLEMVRMHGIIVDAKTHPEDLNALSMD